MRNQKTFLFAAVILITVSIANAELVLTLNGLDAAKGPLEIKGKNNLIIAVVGQTQANADDYSVKAFGGVLEVHAGDYLFTFEDELAVVSLITGKDMLIDGTFVSAEGTIYQLVLFHIPETEKVVAFGVNLETLNFTPPEPEQQISALQTTSSAAGGSTMPLAGGAGDCNDVLDPNWYPNLNDDQLINFEDFAILAVNWLESGDALDGDFDGSETVDCNDLKYLSYFWLASACGPSPEDVFAAFKAALLAGNINEALTFVAEISRDKYAEIFQIIEPNLPDYAAGMGEMTLSSHGPGKVKYEMLHQDGPQTLSFPVFFIRDEDGNWMILNL